MIVLTVVSDFTELSIIIIDIVEHNQQACLLALHDVNLNRYLYVYVAMLGRV